MSEQSYEELKALVGKLAARLDVVEAELAEVKRRTEQEIPEDVLLAISAAVSAYMGNKGKVKAVQLSRHRTWADIGRQDVRTHQPRLT